MTIWPSVKATSVSWPLIWVFTVTVASGVTVPSAENVIGGSAALDRTHRDRHRPAPGEAADPGLRGLRPGPLHPQRRPAGQRREQHEPQQPARPRAAAGLARHRPEIAVVHRRSCLGVEPGRSIVRTPGRGPRLGQKIYTIRGRFPCARAVAARHDCRRRGVLRGCRPAALVPSPDPRLAAILAAHLLTAAGPAAAQASPALTDAEARVARHLDALQRYAQFRCGGMRPLPDDLVSTPASSARSPSRRAPSWRAGARASAGRGPSGPTQSMRAVSPRGRPAPSRPRRPSARAGSRRSSELARGGALARPRSRAGAPPRA